ncbi:MAG TPA: hypothetical protein VGB38_06920 [bacterium]
MKTQNRMRQDHEPPEAIAKGWKYHHLGIPTTAPRDGEVYIEKYKMYVSGFSTSPYGIEWMHFEEGSPIHELIRTVPHVAFEVRDLDESIKGLEIIGPIGSPSQGVRAAMIVHGGAPVELIEFKKE